MKNATRTFLLKLLEVGQMTRSSIPKSALSEIERLTTQGFIDWEKSGRGGVYKIDDRGAVISLLKNTGYHGAINQLTSKAKAVAFHKDAHKGKDETLLLMLSATQKVFWHNNGVSVDVFKIGQECGIASFVIKEGDDWQTDNPIALVENKDLLVNADQYFKKIKFEGTIIYYSGWVSKRTIAWLKTIKNTSITILPDYDPVGILNYLTLKKDIPDLEIYIPKNLPDLLIRYGDPKRLETSTDRKLIEETKDEKASLIYTLLLKHGAGLHQEALILGD